MKKLIYLLIISIAIVSCKKDDETKSDAVIPEQTSFGFYVLNEGNFLANNASISYINANYELSLDPYYDANQVGIGDVLQSFTTFENKGFAVLNNSNTIEVFDLGSWQNIATITGITYPRHIVNVGNGKLFVSAGAMSGSVYVIDAVSHAILGNIAVGNGPERMLIHENKLFVCNSGGWIEDNTLSVIDLSTNQVTQTITVGDRPMDIDLDAYGNVWVLCQGKTVWNDDYTQIIDETPARFVQIAPLSGNLLAEHIVGVIGDHPSVMEIPQSSNTIYYINDALYRYEPNVQTLPGTLFIDQAFNSLDIRNNGELWLTSISDFVNPSRVYRYNTSGEMLHEFTVGMGANGVVFF